MNSRKVFKSSILENVLAVGTVMGSRFDTVLESFRALKAMESYVPHKLDAFSTLLWDWKAQHVADSISVSSFADIFDICQENSSWHKMHGSPSFSLVHQSSDLCLSCLVASQAWARSLRPLFQVQWSARLGFVADKLPELTFSSVMYLSLEYLFRIFIEPCQTRTKYLWMYWRSDHYGFSSWSYLHTIKSMTLFRIHTGS